VHAPASGAIFSSLRSFAREVQMRSLASARRQLRSGLGRRVGLGLGALLAFAACRASVPPGVPYDAGAPDAYVPDLWIEPAHEEATIDGAPVVIDYRAFARGDDGRAHEVTDECTWLTTSPELGAFEGARFTSALDRGGLTTIRASYRDRVATTTLTLRVPEVVLGPGVPADAAARFDAAAEGRHIPDLVYPEDGVVVPPNLADLELHFETGGAVLFELRFLLRATELRVFFACTEPVDRGCIYTPDSAVWDRIATAAGQGELRYGIRGLDAAGLVGASPLRSITITEEPITGGLYYWNAAGGTIDRFEFGVRGARAEVFLGREDASAERCVGCHALSRDGRRISVGTDMPTQTMQVFDVATRSRIFARGMTGTGGAGESNFVSFSPDASLLVGSSLEGLRMLDGDTGELVASALGGGPASMPDFSPDGEHVAFVRHDVTEAGGRLDTMGFTSGRIVRLDRDGDGWATGPTLVESAGQNNYHPAYSPDGAWIAFMRSPSNASTQGPGMGMPGAMPDAQLWVADAEGVAAPLRLARLAGAADSWPKWDPTAYRDQAEPLFWITWSSRRAYGLRLAANARVQLWMAAFRPERAARGEDPSSPAFRLPFQSLESGNHIAQWVTRVERRTCVEDADCGGEFCVDGRCYDVPPIE
jgi:hypothetical protein